MAEVIESINNTKVKQWIKLKQKKYRQKTKTFLVEGEHLIEEAINAGLLDTLILSTEYKGGLNHPQCVYVSAKVMDGLCSSESKSDCVGIVRFPMVKPWDSQILVLEHIQDPGNLGTIVRSALSFGFNTIIGMDCVDLTNDKVVRSTQGALFRINYIESHDIKAVYQSLHEDGYTIYATALKNAVALTDTQFNPKCAIVMGNEGNGLTMDAINGADHVIKIDMATFESLNVAVAASIMMYTAYQQKTSH